VSIWHADAKDNGNLRSKSEAVNHFNESNKVIKPKEKESIRSILNELTPFPSFYAHKY